MPKFAPNTRLGPASQQLFPNYSYCLHCGTTWNLVPGRSVEYDKCRGCFAVCRSCWDELRPDERWEYYREVAEGWQTRLTPEQWATLKQNVLRSP